MFILPILKLGLFCKKRLICRGVSTSVERGSWPPRHEGAKRRTDRGFGSAKIKMQNAKLRQRDVVGMGVLVVASFSISRILYLLDVYYTSKAVGCQVNFNHGFHGFSRICISHREHRGHREKIGKTRKIYRRDRRDRGGTSGY